MIGVGGPVLTTSKDVKLLAVPGGCPGIDGSMRSKRCEKRETYVYRNNSKLTTC